MHRAPVRTLLAALLLVLAVSAPANAKARLGIADEQPAMFTDARFLDLGVHHGRLVVPWDVLLDPGTLARVDRWMAGARTARVAPLVTIGRSRRPGRASANPTPAQMAAALRGWRARWPGQIREVSTWNEGNLNKRPETVARWWLALRRACPSCTVLGADVVDTANVVTWTRRFVKAAHRAPGVWGLHAYVDANRFTTAATRRFLRATTGRVWLTETGGVLYRRHPGARFRGTGAAHAARATRFLLDRIVPLSPRIGRVYVYSWAASTADVNWDSGLVGPDGTPRPALAIVRAWQARHR
jgi:hypothetical protein